MAKDIVVGIDLGTTNSEVAAWHQGRIQVLEENGTALFPSVVGLAPGGELLVGERARNQFVLYPNRTIKSVKRLMGSDQRVALDGREFTPQELSAMVLRALKERAERVLGQPVNKAVITVPAYFSDAQRQATRDAGRIAGLEVVRMIHEPTAAVLAYEDADKGKASKSQTVMIYDLGGGTLDVSIVQVQGDVTEVLASHGDTHLGGDDFDQLVYEHIVAQVREKMGVSVAVDDRALKNRLLRAAEEAKKQLSFEEQVTVREEYVGTKSGVPLHLVLPLTRAELEQLIRPLLDRSLQSVQKALEGAGLQPAKIDMVLLVGGSTRIPLVSNLLEKIMGKKPRKDVHPDLCVAHGAGVMAARAMGQEIEKVLVDVTPYTFGTSCLGEVNGLPSSYMFAPIIRRNTPLPCSNSDDFYTCCDCQERVDVKIFQGEEADARRNILVGRFLINGLSKVPEGNTIRMHMDLDVNGILHVTAREVRTGLEKSVTICDVLTALNEQQLAEARKRLNEIAGDPLSRAFEGVDAADATDAEADAAVGETAPAGTPAALPAPGGAFSGAKVVQARAVIEKAQRLLAKMHADDREEAGGHIQAIEQALAAGDSQRLDTATEQLSEMLFFVEEKE